MQMDRGKREKRAAWQRVFGACCRRSLSGRTRLRSPSANHGEGADGGLEDEEDQKSTRIDLQNAIEAEEYETAAQIRDVHGRAKVSAELEVSAANKRFYAAFSKGDIQSLTNLLSNSDSVRVIHPSTAEVRGFEDVHASWSLMLRESLSSGASIACVHEDVHVSPDTFTAFVTCEEVAVTDSGTGRLAATNVFEYDASQAEWKLMHHHASPITYE